MKERKREYRKNTSENLMASSWLISVWLRNKGLLTNNSPRIKLAKGKGQKLAHTHTRTPTHPQERTHKTTYPQKGRISQLQAAVKADGTIV